MEKVSYLVERLNQLKCYQVYVEFPEDRVVSVNFDEKEKQKVNLRAICAKGTNGVIFESIQFPDAVLLDKNFLYTITEIPNELFSPQAIIPQREHLDSLCCRKCEHVIFTTGEANPITKILELPSEYWYELSELWVCHMPVQFPFPMEEIKAKKEVCFVSANYLMFSPQQFSFEKILIEESKHEKDSPLRCGSCGTLVGITNLSKTDESKSYFKLFKYSIITSANNVFVNECVQYKLAVDIFSLINARSCYRLLVFGYSGRFCCQIQVLSWNSHILSNFPCYTAPHTSSVRPIMKCLYHIVDGELNHASPVEIVQSLKWQMYQVEEIQFPDDECSILLDILSSHARAFPREIRNSFPNMDLSFLLLPQGK